MISRKEYYLEHEDIMFEILKSQIHRETFLLPIVKKQDGKIVSTPPCRWINASYLGMLKKQLTFYEFLEKDMNLYYSMTTYKDMPLFSWKWSIKSQQQKLFMEKYAEYVKDHDMFLETDSTDIMKAWEDSKVIKELLDKYSVYYRVSSSGSKGFHFIVPGTEFDFLKIRPYDQKLEESIPSFLDFMRQFPVPVEKLPSVTDKSLLYKMIVNRIKMLLALDTVDDSVNDIKRVCKTPYSWDCKSGRICYPLDDEMLEHYSNDLITPEAVLKRVNYKRGLLWRNPSVPSVNREQGLKALMTDLGIIGKVNKKP